MARNEEDTVMVTDENFGALLIEGLEAALAVASGEQEPARRHAAPIRHDPDGSRS